MEWLHEEDIIEAEVFAEWAAPIVPAFKSDGTVPVCGDYKVTVNRVVKVENKCVFLMHSVEYLGHENSEAGLKPTAHNRALVDPPDDLL